MDYKLRYQGLFYSRRNVRYDFKIYIKSAEDLPVLTLDTPSDETLTIEWEDAEREEPLCGSSVTLKLVSPGDRTLTDLYTVTPGDVLLKLWRDGQLYWSGTLDPEFYEEDYSCYDDYDVSVTFSDFSIFSRLKYRLNGVQTLNEIINDALQRSGISYTGINADMITTTYADGTPITLSNVAVRSDNFCDEDGEWLHLDEVLRGILQPLALKMVQRGGMIYIYDLNGLYSQCPVEPIVWASNDQLLSCAPVANNAVVTLSTYGGKELISDELTLTSEIDEHATNLTSANTGYYSYYPTYDPEWREAGSGSRDAYSNISFTIHYNGVEFEGLEEIGTRAKAAYIQSFFGAQNTPCIAYYVVYGGHSSINGITPIKAVSNDISAVGTHLVMRTKRAYLPKIANHSRYYIKVELEMLLSPLYNPFEQAGPHNEEGNYDEVKRRTGYMMIPIVVNLVGEDGRVKMHYSNLRAASLRTGIGFLANMGAWEAGADPIESGGVVLYDYINCRLAWYDKSDRAESSGIGNGWAKNKHNIGRTDADINGLLQNLPDGEYIPYPPEGGYLEVKIYSGVLGYDFGQSGQDWNYYNMHQKIRWLLYKAPKVTLVSSVPPFSDVETDDLEYTGELNPDAQDAIEIDTICGTAEENLPNARAILMRYPDLEQIHQLKRGNRTETAEQLLIGTLYSQYAERKTQLSGTADITSAPLRLLSDACQEDRRFFVTSNIENCKEDTTQINAIELRPDEYTTDNG